jgi:hypothetical protein
VNPESSNFRADNASSRFLRNVGAYFPEKKTSPYRKPYNLFHQVKNEWSYTTTSPAVLSLNGLDRKMFYLHRINE